MNAIQSVFRRFAKEVSHPTRRGFYISDDVYLPFKKLCGRYSVSRVVEAMMQDQLKKAAKK